MKFWLIASAALIAAVPAVLPAAAQTADPILLRIAYPSSPSPPLNDGIRPWAEELEKATNGAVKPQITIGPGLGNLENIYHRTVQGVVDLAYGTTGTVGGRFLRTQVCNLPFTAQDSHEASVVTWRMFQNGTTAMEFADAKPIALFTFGSSVIHTNRPIETAADLKGVKIGSSSKSSAEALTLLGAAPVTITPPEFYQAIQRNLVIGVPVSWSGAIAFKVFEVSKHHVEAPFGLAPAYFVMNKDVYAKLPANVRDVIDRLSYEKLSAVIGIAGKKTDEMNRDKIKAMDGHTVSDLAPDERERWRKLLEPIAEEWVRTTPDGPKVLAAFRAEVEKFRREKR
jgi:TRAP-type C4-dicarboxylate transport system substrate-binding protein